MHSVLFAATMPGATDFTARPAWLGFTGYANNKLGHYENVERLAENVWLVNLQISPAPLGFLVAGAEEHLISYRLLPFADAPQWLPVVKNPTPTQGHSAAPSAGKS